MNTLNIPDLLIKDILYWLEGYQITLEEARILYKLTKVYLISEESMLAYESSEHAAWFSLLIRAIILAGDRL